MKIISCGNKEYSGKCSCHNCGATLQYDNSDIIAWRERNCEKSGLFYSLYCIYLVKGIICPICGKKIEIDREYKHTETEWGE